MPFDLRSLASMSFDLRSLASMSFDLMSLASMSSNLMEFNPRWFDTISVNKKENFYKFHT